MKIFVYGSLKRGYRNHRLLQRSTFLGEAVTSDRYRMIDVGFPVLLGPTPDGHHVAGEVYEVDTTTLSALDQLESKGRMYDRVRKYVRMATGESVRLYYYVGCEHAWSRRDYTSTRVQPTMAGVYHWNSTYT